MKPWELRRLNARTASMTGLPISKLEADPGSGPGESPSLGKRLWQLRRWQEKRNPITAPHAPHQYVEHPERYPPEKLKDLPWIFSLARLFPTPTQPMPGRIATIREVEQGWTMLLVEVERRWNLKNEGDPIVLIKRDKSGRPVGALYPLSHQLAAQRVKYAVGYPRHSVTELFVNTDSRGKDLERWQLRHAADSETPFPNSHRARDGRNSNQ
ncbi:hypothetical protein ACTJJ8_13675 [Agrobacterium radiobacter]|uniref:hypothetical protein n=1 Tax=Agrobacterium TaxID=357 RepID=UPI00101A2BE1|nr:hypothetical protein [Agrobacterium sp. CFBP2214]